MHSVCTLAVAYARTNAPDLANQTIQKCLDLGKTSNDLEDRKFANAANVFVRIFDNDIGSAQGSITFLMKDAPDNPSVDEELAIALGHGGHTPEAMSELAVVLKVYEARNDMGSVARCYSEMATVLDTSNSHDSEEKELEFLKEAANIYKGVGDATHEAATDLAIGQYFAKLGRKSDAERYFRQGQELSTRAGSELMNGWVSLFFGNFYFANKQYGKAAELHQEAVAAFHTAKSEADEYSATSAAGLDMEAMGRLDEALKFYFEAQPLADKAGLSSYEDFLQVHIGSVYERQGRWEQARAAFRRAEQLSENANDFRDVASTDLSLAELDALEGDWQDAREETTEARSIFQKAGNNLGESIADAELVDIYSDRTSTTKDFDMARKYYALAQKLHYSKSLELDLLEIDLQTKKYSEAAANARQAIDACRQEKNTDCVANGLISLAEAERLQGHLKAASAALKEAKPLVAKEQDIYLKGRLLYGEANQERATGNFKAAVSFYEQTTELIGEAKGNIDPKSQLSISDEYDYVYDELIDSLYFLSQKEKGTEKLRSAISALNFAEANKARQFEKSWGQTFVGGLRQKLPLDVLQREDTLIENRNHIAAQLQPSISGTDNSSGSASELQEQLVKAESELHNCIQMLRSKYPAYAALKYPQPTSLNSIPLHEGETLVEFKVTDEVTFVWIIRNQSGKVNKLVSFYKVPRTRKWFSDRISRLRDTFNSGQPQGYDPRVSEKLFRSLFPGKHSEEILNSKHLILVPDDVLFLIPFEMLSPDAAQGKYVLLGMPIGYFPSAESLRIARIARQIPKWRDAFLGVGDPITSPSDPRYSLVTALSLGESPLRHETPASATHDEANQVDKLKARGFEFDRLPGTAKEIQSIARLFSDEHERTDVLLGVQATRRDVLDLDLSKFRYIHFATHGILPVDAGVREPSLVLSYDGTAADQMLLPISTIVHLNIDADDVVLSACNTGSGQITRAEGVMSLGRAFMTAGASSVTVSLWEVSDASTALLMKRYYRNLLLGKSKDEALAEARTWLFQNGYTQPYFWAPFILIGE